MRRALLLLAAVALLAAAPANAAEWHSEQPVAAGLGVPASIGEIGDIEFWAPNRGVLITAGNGGSAAGIFAYDGSGWYRYATVCGGHEGRIAWAGPTEFWTISDQQVGQETGAGPARHISLCHFKDGAVVASYAEPVGLPSSYLPMDAAACAAPNDCWFAGERLPGTVNEGAFHLHWDGSSLTALPSLGEPQPQMEDPGRSVTSLAYYGSRFYEGVRVASGDFAPTESASQPFFLHQISSPAALRPFQPVPLASIDYGSGATPEQLEGFRLSGSDAALWAAAGARNAPAAMTVLRKTGSGSFAQVPLGGGVLGSGDALAGLAAEPDGEAAWLGFRRAGEFEATGPARLARVHSDGSVDAEVTLPASAEGIGDKGTAGPVACAAAEQCWMATTAGWLFHLGPSLPRDEDPAMHALIEFRPPDDSLPAVPPISLPEDDSGASGSPFEYTPKSEAEVKGGGKRPRAPKLLVGLHQRVIGGRLLELTFVLKSKAHVQLLARRKGQVVAKTPRLTLGVGHQSLRLRLDPKRWPTKLDLKVHPLKQRGKK